MSVLTLLAIIALILVIAWLLRSFVGNDVVLVLIVIILLVVIFFGRNAFS